MPKSTDTPCIDPGFGYENGDGYVRIWNYPKGTEGSRLVMRHRWFWELQVEDIRDGYEIDHLCKNRRCCNIGHLRCIPKAQHVIENNKERYVSEYQEFKDWYLKGYKVGNYSQRTMGELFNRTQSCICLWINKINNEN